jgi:hypothetical protein
MPLFQAEMKKIPRPEFDEHWRRRRDSNPRDPFESNGFQDRRLQPLGHSSGSNLSALRDLGVHLRQLWNRNKVSPEEAG